ncbi:hypothetical protein Poly30_05320 [Planctomycetes bacterium Poly30]|uniref:Uncharacterized protein n=1 Tax=Saltatorellus ferox TaxID=2528018 RepID=A0A518ELS1_9BACT|nr:hypothetical protein Poly30_05320 [Planctomycetes bacterium Poly30]
MSTQFNLAGSRTAAAALLLGFAGCQSLPTLESIKYGYSPSRADVQPEPPKADDYNDVAAGWAPERPAAGTAGVQPAMYGRDGRPVGVASPDGSPVGNAAPGAITQTTHPMNDGVARDDGSGGSRGTMLEKYLAVVEELDILRPQNEDLQLALEMSEMRANDLTEQLKALQVAYDELGASKQTSDSQNFELAARLATAQIARLEAERALLEATLEWRKMSAANNQPLAQGNGRPASSSGSFQPASGGARRK